RGSISKNVGNHMKHSWQRSGDKAPQNSEIDFCDRKYAITMYTLIISCVLKIVNNKMKFVIFLS
ncbi:MAG: hypothetical protein NC320_11565, partial [Clostridium sp.]|nr:hypothetical protein [Clostridium sp.]MCM1548215.1 hypothetical protein [Ruminococcus sp.]